MSDTAVDRALASVSDRVDPDWDALEAQSPTDDDRQLLRSLRDVARIGRQCSLPPAPPTRTLPFTWGPLQVRQWIARGAHGDVYRAWDPHLERDVALKLLRTTSAGEREVTAVAEGRLLARVHQPNVVSVYGADRIDGQAGVWMEFLSGRTLREEVEARGGLPAPHAIACAIDMCSALSAVHGARLIHRDVKAQNIVRTTDGRTVLMDFGAGEDARTRSRGIEGTPVYLAPELLSGGAASRASEVYAVGVLLFFMLACSYPASGATIEEIKRVHESRAWIDPAATLPASPALRAIVNRALARRPEDRFPTAEALGDALQALVRPAVEKRRTRFAATASALTAAVGACVALAATDARLRPLKDGPRRITMPSEHFGLPSRDGRRYPYVDYEGQLQYWQVDDKTIHVVSSTEPGVALRSPVMSPDGSLAAYTAALPDGFFELRATDVARGESRDLILREREYEPIAADWSADGSRLLCWLRQKSGTLDLALLSADNGAMRPLFSVSSGTAPPASLSPDGRFVITLQPGENKDDGWGDFGSRNGQLVLIPVDGSGPHVLLRDAGEDAYPSWLPDGHAILFLRPSITVPGSHDAWIVRLGTDMRPDQPYIFQPNAGSEDVSAAYTVNAAGDLQEFSDSRAQEVYLEDFDSRTGDVTTPLRIDPQNFGNHVGPSWSPDGLSIAFFTTAAAAYSGAVPLKTLTIKDVETGRIRSLKPRLSFLGGYRPEWTRDSHSVVVWGRDTGDNMRTGYYIVDVLSGDTRPFVVGGVEAPACSQFAPDGRHYLFDDNVTGIVSLDLATGVRRLVLPLSTFGHVDRFAVSADGSAIAFISHTERAEGGRAQTIGVFRDNAASPITRSSASEGLELVGWTSDGQYVLYARGHSTEGNPVFEIPPEGGTSRPTGLRQQFAPNVFTLSPDGRHVAYTENVRRHELRIIPLPRN